MKVTMAKTAIVFFMLMGSASLIVLHVYGSTGSDAEKNLKVGFDFDYQINRMQALKTSLLRRRDLISISPSPAISVSPSPSYRVPPISSISSRVYQVTTAYGADPTGKTDSTEALQRAINDAFRAPDSGQNKILMQGIIDLGGAEIYLEGGAYMISSPLQLPSSGGGNLLIHGGSLRASDDFPKDRYLIELSATSTSTFSNSNAEVDKDEQISMDEKLSLSSFTYEDITLKDLMLDSNFNGGGIAVINSVRTTIDNCYITHFTSNGILVRGGHETYIHNSFLGQRITAGGDPSERNFTGIGINLMGNDNAVTDVVIFSAATGIMISGQANILTGVHCYNKATGWGGTGIYLRLPGLTQTRIVNSYLDYTGIVAEDPVQLQISNTFFLGDAYIVLKSIKGVMKGVNIVDNMFSGNDKGVDIIQLDQSKGVAFSNVDQILIDRNSVQGMRLRTTVAKSWVQGNGSSWTVDFNGVLLFPDHIKHVQYTLRTNIDTDVFPNHALRNVSGNRVVVKSDVVVPASIYVTVDQSTTTTVGN